MAKLKAYFVGIAIIAVFILCFGLLKTTTRINNNFKLRTKALKTDSVVVSVSKSKQPGAKLVKGGTAYTKTNYASGFLKPDVDQLYNTSVSSEIKGLLKLIEEIFARDSSGRGPVEAEEKGGFECDQDSPKFHGVVDLLCVNVALIYLRPNVVRAETSGTFCVLDQTPPKFSPNYTNPCWQGTDGNLRCLPYFQIRRPHFRIVKIPLSMVPLKRNRVDPDETAPTGAVSSGSTLFANTSNHVIGMDKCGSTDLFDRIAKHPSVLMNKGNLNKETMMWSWRRYWHWLKTTSYRKPQTFDDYLNYFSDAAKVIRNNKSWHFVTGDGTPMDLWHMCGLLAIPQNSGLQEPKYITPHLIRHVNPGVKLIAIFRDPVERLFSEYFFLGQGIMTVKGFHNAVRESIKLLHVCTRQFSLRTCVYSKLVHLKIKARIHLGFYSIFLRDWFRVFPRKQFLILRTEDYSDDMEGHLLKIFRFLGLRDLTKPEMETISEANRKHVTQRQKRVGKMLPDTRLLLEHLYQGPKQNVAELLYDPRYLWAKS